MHFVSLNFLIFFVVVFSVYWAIQPHRGRMIWLLAASVVFYMSWNPWLILLILFSASVDYFAAIQLERCESPVWRKRWLIGSITVNLGLLAFFKYTNFFLANLTGALNLVGIDFQQRFFRIALPLGISFYTFETISYMVDVYKGRIKAQRNLVDYALFIMFFPHLLAGPIVRPGDFLPQLHRPKRWSWSRLHLGGRLFLRGVFKKAVIADSAAGIVEAVFQSPGDFGSLSIWVAAFAYAVQVYGDFSGYSDMAIGLAHTFGFKLPINFDYPYLAAGFSDFWRRWHISLSSWLRDYLFFPLGGSRVGEAKTHRNLLFVMFISGIWHGANWPSVLWGLYHGVLLSLERLLTRQRLVSLNYLRPLAIPATLLLSTIGFAIFRSQSLGDISVILGRMFWPVAGEMLSPVQAIIASAGILAIAIDHLAGRFLNYPRAVPRWAEPVVAAGWTAAAVAAMLLMPETDTTFIYFQF